MSAISRVGSTGWRALRLPAGVGAALVAAIVLLVNPTFVSGHSMEPLLAPGDLLTTSRVGPIQRGDVVVVNLHGNSAMQLVKRVIGLPGEQLRLSGGSVYVNEQRLYEPYLFGPWTQNTEYQDGANVQLGPDSFFILGDNRENSVDSRFFGAVTKSQIVGRSWSRVWPRPQPLDVALTEAVYFSGLPNMPSPPPLVRYP